MSTREGWTWLWNAPKEHYFREGRSLCGRWLCLGSDLYPHPSEVRGKVCSTCLKKLEREESKERKCRNI